MSKDISIIGVGKLGLCFGLNLERSGFNITGVDINEDYVNSLNNNTFNSNEPGVNELLSNTKNIRFTTSVKEALENDIIFVVVETPSTSEWKYDHTQIEAVADSLIKLGKQDRPKELIISSTTFPGYCNTLQEKLQDYNYNVSFNPEFICQGTILQDQLYSDFVIIGEYNTNSGDIIESIYNKLCKCYPKYVRVTRTEGELAKLAINCFLTTKISFANMVGDIATRLDCNPNKVLEAVGADSRIGTKYLKPGFGFGGPCFPRDNRALAKCGDEVGIDAVVSKATDIMNEKHLQYQIEEFIKNNPDKSIPVEIEYVTYNKNSTLLTESQQLKYALELQRLGYIIVVKDERQEVVNQLMDTFYGN